MVKNPPASARDMRDTDSILELERSLEKEVSSQSSILAWENPMDRGAWWVAKSQLHLSK